MRASIHKSILVSTLSIALLSACGGGGGSSVNQAPAAQPTLNPTAYDIKQLVFSWPAYAGSTIYRILENPDNVTGYGPVSPDLPANTLSFPHEIAVHLQDWTNASYMLEACNATGCTTSAAVFPNASAQAVGYFKASNAEVGDNFGQAVAVSDDGSTLAVGAWTEDSDGSGQADNAADAAGAVYIYRRAGMSWAQEAYIKASNAEAGDNFGFSVALSHDGNTLAVGAWREDGNGIAGEADNSAPDAGAAYVFTYAGGVWTQVGYIKASNAEATDRFGHAVALSDDGMRLAVGASHEDSNGTGGADNSAIGAGAVYVYDGNLGWTQEGYLKPVVVDAGDAFGISVALNADGTTLAAGAWLESGDGSGPGDNSAPDAGAAYVFTRAGAVWSQEAYVKPVTVDAGDNFGLAVSLSADGDTFAAGAYHESGNGSSAADNSAPDAGAAYVFVRNLGAWSQQAYIKPAQPGSGDHFGISVALNSNDGDTLAVGATLEDGAATGVGGDQSDNTANGAGAAFVFTRSAGTWSQRSYVKASNTGAGDTFGVALALSGDAATLAVGADGEAGSAGAVYLY